MQSSNQCENKGLMGEVEGWIVSPRPSGWHFRSAPVRCRCRSQFLEQELPPPRVALQVSLQSSYTYCPRLLIGIHLCSGTEKVLVRGQARSCSTIPGYALPAREFLRDRNCRLAAHPKRHLATVRSVKNVSLDAGSGLTGRGNPVRSRFHELRKIDHRTSLDLNAGTYHRIKSAATPQLRSHLSTSCLTLPLIRRSCSVRTLRTATLQFGRAKNLQERQSGDWRSQDWVCSCSAEFIAVAIRQQWRI